MPRFLDEAVYYATAPIRLFGRSRGFRLALAALCTLAVFSYGALLAFDRLLPAGSGVPPELAKIAPPPPLPPVTRTSYVIAPVAVALRAIQRKLDDAAPRQFAGKNDNAVSSLLSKADIGITLERRTLSMAGKPNEMTVATPVTGMTSRTSIPDQLESAALQGPATRRPGRRPAEEDRLEAFAELERAGDDAALGELERKRPRGEVEAARDEREPHRCLAVDHATGRVDEVQPAVLGHAVVADFDCRELLYGQPLDRGDGDSRDMRSASGSLHGAHA